MSDRLKALSDAGVSIWLDDLSRERIETGNLAELVKEKSRRRRDHQPDDLRRRHRRRRALRRPGARPRRREGEPSTGSIFAAHHRGRPQRLRHPGAGLRRHRRRDGRVSIEVEPDLANDTEGTIAVGPRPVAAGRPAQRADQDPRHRGGAAGDHRGDRARASASTSR